MIPLESKLESSEKEFTEVRGMLEEHAFALGGNWDYDHGYFDRSLDEERMVWLRVPFDVINGSIDEDTQDLDAKIKMGRPFVLKHVYNEGLDAEAHVSPIGSLMDQFQEPVDADAEVESKWVAQAKKVLAEVEERLLH
ncbi:YugN-like family protein [Paenibacillus sp. MWE-103]|uniref:YugN-like family protein n=1 Tax=Paenibacillus artemisiicola TaxID=1172618 RepID=A0ABS3WAA3_9BACL|nr:YugN-like family protein [Paenibacillus artemisiicola]MBO7745252.1 YugN-like family protein [Paenibacillus artemisiicola]